MPVFLFLKIEGERCLVNHLTGTQVWRTADGIHWYQSNQDGFGDAENYCSYCMAVFENYLYVGTGNEIARVWRTKDGVMWEQANSDGFGDSDNKRVHSFKVFGEYLYAGAGNKKGAEVWRCQAPEDDGNNCFFETVFEHEPRKASSLQMVRDAILSSSEDGAEYIALYYRYSSELAEIYSAFPGIREETQEVLAQLMPGIALLQKGKQVELTTSMTRRLHCLLEEYARAGSPGLKEALKEIKIKLRNNNLSGMLNTGTIKKDCQLIIKVFTDFSDYCFIIMDIDRK